MTTPRDHGGRLDAAIARHGGMRADWLDLSTGINPLAYPLPPLAGDVWTALPDRAAADALTQAARRFWAVPDGAAVLAAPGASALIARLPACLTTHQTMGLTRGPAAGPTGAPTGGVAGGPAGGTVAIPGPTYNEHRAAFVAAGWTVADQADHATGAMVVVHPNNPDGRLWRARDLGAATLIIDESFCDIAPDASLIALAARPGVVVLKSFGKFWGLAGLRLGFAIGDPAILAQLAQALGPWPVSGPALGIGTAALGDPGWALDTRARLTRDAARLDGLMAGAGASAIGGTTLFRLYQVGDAAAWQARLARARVLGRTFPYNPGWLRLGLPHPDRWPQIEAAL